MEESFLVQPLTNHKIMEEFTKEEIKEIERRIANECKDHDWIVIDEEDCVSKCSKCNSLLFFAEENSLEVFMKYLEY